MSKKDKELEKFSKATRAIRCTYNSIDDLSHNLSRLGFTELSEELSEYATTLLNSEKVCTLYVNHLLNKSALNVEGGKQ